MPTKVVLIRPATGYLFESRQEAWNELLRVSVECMRDIVAAGGTLPSPAKMAKDIDYLWESEWKFTAPPHDRKASTR